MALDDPKIVIDVKKLRNYYNKIVDEHNHCSELHQTQREGFLWDGVDAHAKKEMLKFIAFLLDKGDRI